MTAVSQAAIDLVINCEVTSKAVYEKRYMRPEWPGGSSGVTIGIGYDLGYASPAKIKADWGTLVDAATFAAMIQVAGVHGDIAKAACADVHSKISISWSQAVAIFMGRDVPQYCADVLKVIPQAATLPPDCFGVLFSLAYNRGAGCFTAKSDRYVECRNIRELIAQGELAKVPAEIRKMKRLWVGTSVAGLVARREQEALLWEKGLRVPAAAPSALIPTAAPPQAMPKPPASAGTHAPAAITAASTAIGTKQAAQAGWSPTHIALLVAAGLVVAIVVWLVTRNATAPLVARQKDIPDPVTPTT